MRCPWCTRLFRPRRGGHAQRYCRPTFRRASSKLALRDWLFGADPVLAWAEARVREGDPARHGYKSGDAHRIFRQWALANGFREAMIPAVNGFVQRLQANLPYAVVKHTRSGNWLRGIEILSQDQNDDEDDRVKGR